MKSEKQDIHRKELKRKWNAEHKEANAKRCIRWYSIPENAAKAKQRSAQYKIDNIDHVKENRKRHYQENKERILAQQKDRYIKNRDKILATGKVWRENNKERKAAADKKWHKNNPEAWSNMHHKRKAQKLGLVHDDLATIRKHISSAKNVCYWCGKRLYGRNWHMDHVIPLSKNGNHIASNIVKSCPACNLSKGKKMPHEWTGAKQLVML
jgi:5-methylcytosine-specific restriction endonuclease McrA